MKEKLSIEKTSLPNFFKEIGFGEGFLLRSDYKLKNLLQALASVTNTIETTQFHQQLAAAIDQEDWKRPLDTFESCQTNSRFNQSPYEQLFPTYPANFIKGFEYLDAANFVIGEGPAPAGSPTVEDLLDNLFTNLIRHIIIAGAPDQGSYGFFDYVNKDGEYGHYKVKVKKHKNVLNESCRYSGIHLLQLEISNSFKNISFSIDVLQIKTALDFGVAELKYYDYILLAKWLKIATDHTVFVHCAAGKGRSGAIVATILLALNHNIIKYNDIDASKQNVLNLIENIRKVRPGAVQTSDQRNFVVQAGCYLREMVTFSEENSKIIKVISEFYNFLTENIFQGILESKENVLLFLTALTKNQISKNFILPPILNKNFSIPEIIIKHCKDLLKRKIFIEKYLLDFCSLIVSEYIKNKIQLYKMKNGEGFFEEECQQIETEILVLINKIAELNLTTKQLFYPEITDKEMNSEMINKVFIILNFNDVNFGNLNLSNTKFNYAYLNNATINCFDLENSDFSFTKLNGARILSDLSNVKFKYAQLQAARIGGASNDFGQLKQLSNVDFSYANAKKMVVIAGILECLFEATELEKANFESAKCCGNREQQEKYFSAALDYNNSLDFNESEDETSEDEVEAESSMIFRC